MKRGHDTPVKNKIESEKNGIIWAALRLKMVGAEHDLDKQDDGLKRVTSQCLRNKSKNGIQKNGGENNIFYLKRA